MVDDSIVQKLRKKQKELEEVKSSYQNKLTTINSQLNSLSETINLFVTPEHPIIHFEYNERQKIIINLLKESPTPISTIELSQKIQKLKNIEFISKKEQTLFNKNLTQILTSMRKKEMIEPIGKDGLTYIWQIKPINS